MRINDGERLIKQNGVDIGSDQTTAQRNLLFVIGVQATRLFMGKMLQPQHHHGISNTLVDLCITQLVDTAPVTQRERQVLSHGHGVVQHRKLKYLRNVALLCGQLADVGIIKKQLTLTGCH